MQILLVRISLLGFCTTYGPGKARLLLAGSTLAKNSVWFHLPEVYDQNHYFGLGLISKPKPKLADSFG